MNESVNDIVAGAKRRRPHGGQAPLSILVVDVDPAIGDFLRPALAEHCALVEVAESIARAEALRQRYHFDILIIDADATGQPGMEWLHTLRAHRVTTPAIVTTGQPDRLETPGGAAGGVQILPRPFSVEQVVAAVEKAATPAAPGPPAPGRATPGDPTGVVGDSAAIRGLLDVLRRVAPRSTTVLLEGESGTGKEVAARCLHHFSGRRGPFVPVNCGSIAPELLESELFGHVKGAFTGATQGRDGLFVHAHRGTLFLDEICEMPLPMQAKLLRVLEERTIRPVGAEREVPVDARIVAATNCDMGERVAAGAFREDLYYRLNVLGLRLPALRERPDDIPHLARQFTEDLALELSLPPLAVTDGDLRQLAEHDWPGNVRELRNLVERAMLLDCAPAECLRREQGSGTDASTAAVEAGFPPDMPLEEVERRHILKVLETAGGNKSEAARRLGVSRKTLERKVRLWRDAE